MGTVNDTIQKTNKKKMKALKFFAALSMGFAVLACTPKAGEPAQEGEQAQDGQVAQAPAKEEAPAEFDIKSLAPTSAEKDTVAYLLGVYFGQIVKFNNFGEDISFCRIRKGFNDVLKAEGNPQDPEYGAQFKINPAEIDRIFNAYLSKQRDVKAHENGEAGKKYIAKMEKQGAQKTESGLCYIIEEPGTEVVATDADTVYVHYKLTDVKGKVIEEIAADAEPAKMVLRYNIAGFREGLKLIGEGGKIKLIIPADLAYGPQGNRGIEPNSTLVFEVGLDKIGKTVAQ